MRVAVLGSGNGALAIAFEWAQAGHEVAIFDFEQFEEVVAAINQRGGIGSDGELEGFQPISYAGHDISRVVPDADLVFAVGPAYSTRPFAEACRPHVRAGQTYVVCPGSCGGAIIFKREVGLDLADETVAVAETSTLPYAVRITGTAQITVYNRLKGGYYVAALPHTLTDQVYELLRSVHREISPAQSVLQTTLQNSNPIIHPAVTLCNAGLIERTGGDFLFYEEGVTPAVGRVIESLDLERLEIGKRLGVPVKRDPVIGIEQGYQEIDDYGVGYSEAPGFLGIRAQPQLDYRYLNEDAGFGLVFFTDLGRQIGVPTPNMSAVLRLSSVLMARDYEAEGARTMASLGLADYSLHDLKQRL